MLTVVREACSRPQGCEMRRHSPPAAQAPLGRSWRGAFIRSGYRTDLSDRSRYTRLLRPQYVRETNVVVQFQRRAIWQLGKLEPIDCINTQAVRGQEQSSGWKNREEQMLCMLTSRRKSLFPKIA